jgi:hypothetical protein
MNAKSFFYVAAGLFLLTAAYTIGASRAQGQATSSHVVGVTGGFRSPATGFPEGSAVAVTDNGDWYYLDGFDGVPRPWSSVTWQRGGNIGLGTVGIGAVPWSGVKDSYRK